MVSRLCEWTMCFVLVEKLVRVGKPGTLAEMHVHMLPIPLYIFFKMSISSSHFICHNAIHDYPVNSIISFIQICFIVSFGFGLSFLVVLCKMYKWTWSIPLGSSLRFEGPTWVSNKTGMRCHVVWQIRTNISEEPAVFIFCIPRNIDNVTYPGHATRN